MYARVSILLACPHLGVKRLSDGVSIVRIAFMSSSTTGLSASTLPLSADIIEDKVEYWVGYPLTTNPVPFRPALYFRERCKLSFLFQELYSLFLTNDTQRTRNARELANAVERLSVRMQRWHRYLPFELHYVWPMSVAIWELQCVDPAHSSEACQY